MTELGSCLVEEYLNILAVSLATIIFTLLSRHISLISRKMTLFSRAEHNFKVVEGKEEIPTEPFLLACNQILPFIGELRAWLL